MEETRQRQDLATEKIRSALASRDIPHLYANGFANVLSSADVVTVLERHNVPVAVLSMSYTTAKSLAEKLSQLITSFEQASEQTILTTDVVDQALSQSVEGQP